MTIEAFTGLLGVIVWPAVVLIAVVLLRRELAGLFGRVREIEGPGSLKVSLDPNKVEQIITEGRKENAPPAEVAERIVQTATILDKREGRILRALLDDDGRAIYSYQSDYYRPALESLLAKGYVQKLDRGYALTQEGRRVTQEYIQGVLRGFGDPRHDETARSCRCLNTSRRWGSDERTANLTCRRGPADSRPVWAEVTFLCAAVGASGRRPRP